jgi:hypothetical protein
MLKKGHCIDFNCRNIKKNSWSCDMLSVFVDAGALTCISCLQGTFASIRGSTECLVCPQGSSCPNSDTCYTEKSARVQSARVPERNKRQGGWWPGPRRAERPGPARVG